MSVTHNSVGYPSESKTGSDPKPGTFAYTFSLLVDTSEFLSNTKKVDVVNQLAQANEVLSALRDLPRITPQTPATRFSALSPSPRVESEEDLGGNGETQAPSSKSRFNVLRKVRRKK